MVEPLIQKPEITYVVEEDTLRIDLTPESSVISDEVAENIVVDYNAAGEPVAIEIDGAAKILEEFVLKAAAAMSVKSKQ